MNTESVHLVHLTLAGRPFHILQISVQILIYLTSKTQYIEINMFSALLLD